MFGSDKLRNFTCVFVCTCVCKFYVYTNKHVYVTGSVGVCECER